MASDVGMGLGVKGMQLAEDQIKVLEENFTKVTKHPDETTLMLIAAECGLSEEDTAKWFRLRNALWRQAEGLPAELGSVKDWEKGVCPKKEPPSPHVSISSPLSVKLVSGPRCQEASCLWPSISLSFPLHPHPLFYIRVNYAKCEVYVSHICVLLFYLDFFGANIMFT